LQQSGKDDGDEHVSENGEVCENNPEREGKGVIYLEGADALEGKSEPRDCGNASDGRSTYGLKMHRGYASHVLYRVKHERFCLCQERSRDADKQTNRHAY
jgi:hypothetical protein